MRVGIPGFQGFAGGSGPPAPSSNKHATLVVTNSFQLVTGTFQVGVLSPLDLTGGLTFAGNVLSGFGSSTTFKIGGNLNLSNNVAINIPFGLTVEENPGNVATVEIEQVKADTLSSDFSFGPIIWVLQPATTSLNIRYSWPDAAGIRVVRRNNPLRSTLWVEALN